MLSDIEIAENAELKDIREIAAQLSLTEDELELYGKYKAKLSLPEGLPRKGKLILVTAIMSTNGTLQLFDESVNLTRGGPGNMTITMSHYIYNTMFTKNPNFGYAAAMSFVILVMVAVLAAIQMKVGDKR